MTVVLAGIAAFLYGLSDFVGGVASRRTSVWPVSLLACLGGLLGATVLAVAVPGHPGGTDLAWGLVAGLGSGSGTAFLYRGLAAGRMGVVAPISGVGAVVLPLLVGVGAGERPALIGWTGMVLALPGIWLVSREPVATAAPGADSGVLDGVLAGLGFGIVFAALGQVGSGAGFWPLAAMQASSLPALLLAALVLGGDPRPRARGDLWGLVPGALATVAVLCFMLATRHGLLSIAAVITSLYPAFTVLLAIGVLREHVHRAQWLGLGLCATSIVLVSLA